MEKITKNIDLSDAKYYLNRELSLIEFNYRVLLEGTNKKHPLLERLKFLTILSSNLDEFFMIRVAGLKSQVAADLNYLSYDGKTPQEQLLEIRNRLLPIYKLQEDILIKEILPELSKNGIHILKSENLLKKDKEYFKDYFFENIFPLLTPLILSASHPFPRLVNRSLNLAYIIRDPEKKNEETSLAFLQIPMNLPRFLKLDNRPGDNFVLIESIIKEFSHNLFPGLIIEQSNTFRITRDADIEIAEDEAEDLISEIEEQIKLRRWGKDPVRLEVNHKMPPHLLQLLTEVLELEKEDVYIVNRPLNLQDFMSLMKIDKKELKDSPFTPITNLGLQKDFSHIFDEIKKRDILVHHPFDSFISSTVSFIESSANDKDVLAIKITLYRAGGDSLIIKALQKAAEQGKNVTAFVELKARFDEENNIIWARELEQSGVHVIYGVSGLKTHCKIAMVVRKEENKLKTYLHISTGNYNQGTAKLYTDVAFFTAKDSFADEAVQLFNYLTGISRFKDWKDFQIAPINLRQNIIKMINREADKSTKENPGEIIAKMNSIAHKEVIQALYKASQKGVNIKLLVRGVCCLKPGIKGISENIEVRSIIGRFLEHSRIFYFKNNGDEEYYISSADWMTRNLHQRVELSIPIYDKKNTKKLREIFDSYWEDNINSWQLNENGDYIKLHPNENEIAFSGQDYFLKKTHKLRQKNN